MSPVPRVTSQDVARRAGVSQSTVSIVLSGKAPGRISEATAVAVRRAAEELGYRPNVAARTLRTGRTGAVGLVVPDVTNPFFGGLLRGAQTAARGHGLTVALVDAANDPELGRSGVEALRSAAVDGYLAFEVRDEALASVDEPVVAIEAWEGAAPRVRLDVERGIEATLGHLLELGHRRLGHLASAIDVPTFRVREERAGAELAAAGHDPADVVRVRSRFTLEDARKAGHELLDAGPSAVFCDDDVLAAGLHLAARERGLAVPEDLSITGFDDLDLARVLDLTTVAVDPKRLGRTAIEVLARLMEGGRVAEETVVPVELVVRGSTGPPPRG